MGGTAQPVSAKNTAKVPNRLGNRKFIDVSPSGSGRVFTTLLCGPDGKCAQRPARTRAGG
ncbi:hypothetical protein BW685_29465 [Burkholderia ubonensis]|uniref:Uncharacterized protein n=1 Tax=Burkholderia ubonensis TaxID=101571 RepID=A0A1R1J3P1_9BURK|nr:hypothetical protein BW685_29465 [Burkholderia ubonensis]